ncbi:MAG: hypothetical protein PHQ64_00460 [Bacilli bacterium]|nr:hypothetical protein [Bacilli bacterium]
MDKDIKEMFDRKNKEIILTNLKYDLSRNIDSMKDTIVNIFDREFEVGSKKIILMINDYYENIDYKNFNIKFLDVEKKILDKLFKLIEEKLETLNHELDDFEFNESSIGNYYNKVIQSTSELKNVFVDSWFIDTIDSTIKLTYDLFSLFDDDRSIILSNRLDDYINNRFFDKIILKLNEEFSLRDSNLINKAEESYNRYLDICKNVEN